jgi:hypothetical protein
MGEIVSAAPAPRRPLPVAPHQLRRPGRFADLAARGEAAHVGLDVEDGRAVDRVEAADLQLPRAGGEQAAGRDPDPVDPRLAPLREDAERRQVVTPTRPARAGGDRRRIDPVEEEDDLDVGELAEAGGRLRPDRRGPSRSASPRNRP